VADATSQLHFDRLQRALAAGATGAWEIHLPARRAWFSDAFRTLLAADERSLPDSLEALEARVHPEDVDRVRAVIDRQQTEPGRLEVEFRARSRDGRFAWFEAIGIGVREHGGTAGSAAVTAGAAPALGIRLSGVLRPADLRREPGRDGASTARASFLAAMSHEIRTPMTAILGFADVLAEHGTADEVQRSAADAIRRNGEHLIKIVNDILDLSRIEAGAMAVEEIAVSPIEIVEEVVESLRPRVRGDQVELVVELLGPVPSLIRTDPTRLRQILLNLVDNALKFTERGSVRIALERGPGDSIRVHVTDTGIGIAPEQVDRLFRPFAQAETSTVRRYGGSGLGLDISRRLARMLGGEITVRSTPGRGSTFSVEVSTGPLAGVPMVTTLAPEIRSWRHGAASGAASGAVSGAAPGALNGSSRALRILLAEDGADNERLIRHHLEREGMQVASACTGRAAVDLTLAARRRGEPFDVILMDLGLPEMDGVQATRAVREAGFTGAIVALTANADGAERDRVVDAGADSILPKPIDRARLIESIRRAAAGRAVR